MSSAPPEPRPSVLTDKEKLTTEFKAEVHALIDRLATALPDDVNPVVATSALASLMAQYAVASGVPQIKIMEMVAWLWEVAKHVSEVS